MKKILFFSALCLVSIMLQSQTTDNTISAPMQNSAERLLARDGKLLLGGYGEVHYNQPFGNDTKNNGTLDVHRIVLLMGYNFTNRLSFISEIEFEHVSEVYVEQAFLQYKLNNYINLRGGLILIPMGIINEYHEPTTFNGVERPLVDKHITPTTWREVGFGLTGNILPVSLRYQLYVVNGFNGYDGTARLDGKNGLRKGRQKGAESYISSPNYSGKVEFYGIRGLNIGLSAYTGKTQSSLYDGIPKNDEGSLAMADSSVVGINMIGLDARYSISGLQLRGQYYFTSLSNTWQYNTFTGDTDAPNNLGSAMIGYYLEAGYNIFKLMNFSKTEFIPFVRYEVYDTQSEVEENIVKNDNYKNTVITAGISWKLNKGAVVKADVQFIKSALQTEYPKTFNLGFGVMF